MVKENKKKVKEKSYRCNFFQLTFLKNINTNNTFLDILF